jgi:hypothetical protein
MGRKPLAFCAFLFEQLGMLPGDELADLFPGTGIVSRAWAELSRDDASARAVGDDQFETPVSPPGSPPGSPTSSAASTSSTT